MGNRGQEVSITKIKDTKNGKLPTSHRYDHIPLLRSRPGEILQELVV